MNGLQLWHALSTNKVTAPKFSGVYAVDTLIKIYNKPKMIVCNTQASYKPGEHWLLFFFDTDTVEMFDSVGKELTDYAPEIVNMARKFGKVSRVLKNRVQPDDTSLCGHYCLLYAWCRCNGQTMEAFSQDVPPASFIEFYVNSLFDIPDVSSNYQICKNC